MKLAEVKCASQSRSTTHRVPSGRKYRFRSGERVEVTALEDVRYFAESPAYDVNWTARGMLAAKMAGGEDSVADAISEFSYRAKQELAKTFGIKANQSEEDLEEQLQEAAKDLEIEMENY